MSQIRVQKLIAEAGICSRRKAEKLILEGRVRVNDRRVTELGTKANPEVDRISVDDKMLQYQKKTYLLLNKPPGYICSLSDDAGRKVVFDLVEEKRRLVTVGRLDYATEGALILTNDGELVHGLTHPSSQVPREYEVKIKMGLTDQQIGVISKGVLLDDGPVPPIAIEPVRRTDRHVWYSLTLTEGRNREVRRIIESVGGTVLKLKRVSFAGMTIDKLPLGMSRPINPGEVISLYEQAGLIDGALLSEKRRRDRAATEAEKTAEKKKKEADKKRGQLKKAFSSKVRGFGKQGSNSSDSSKQGKTDRKPKRGTASPSKGRKKLGGKRTADRASTLRKSSGSKRRGRK